MRHVICKYGVSHAGVINKFAPQLSLWFVKFVDLTLGTKSTAFGAQCLDTSDGDACHVDLKHKPRKNVKN